MISCRFSFVKHFFQVFSNFFSAFIRKIFNFSYPGSVELGRRSRKQLDYVTTRSFVCQALFSDFSNLFSSTQPAFELVARALSSARLSYQSKPIMSTSFSYKTSFLTFPTSDLPFLSLLPVIFTSISPFHLAEGGML